MIPTTRSSTSQPSSPSSPTLVPEVWHGHIIDIRQSNRPLFRRDIIMKKGTQLTKIFWIVLLLVFAILGACIAFITYYQYKTIARGILGITLLYLILNHNPFRKGDGTIEAMLSHSNKFKYFILVFIYTLISYWATAQIFEMIFFYFKK